MVLRTNKLLVVVMLAGAFSLLAVGLCPAQVMSSANFRISAHTFSGGASTVDATNATCDSANFRSLHQASFVAVSVGPAINASGNISGPADLPSSASFRNSRGFLFTIWGLGTRDTVWIGGTGAETSTAWATNFNWGYGVPTAARHARVSPAMGYPLVTTTIPIPYCNSFTVEANTSAQVNTTGRLDPAANVDVYGTLTIMGDGVDGGNDGQLRPAGNVNVAEYGTLTLNAGGELRPGANIDVYGTFTVIYNSSVIRMLNGNSITVQSSGILNLTGTPVSTNRAVIKGLNITSDFYALVIYGRLNAEYSIIQSTNSNGLDVRAGANILQLNNCSFDSLFTGPDSTYIKLPNGSVSGATTFFGCTFAGWGPTHVTYPTYNVYSQGTPPAHPIVTFTIWTGTLGGEDYDYDPYNRVFWGGSAEVVRVVGGVDQGTYATITEAFATVAANGTVIDVRDNVIRQENLTFPDYDNVVLQRAILNGTIIGDDDKTGETVRNCLILGGNDIGGGNDTTALGYVYNTTVVEGNIRAYSATGYIRNCIIVDTNSILDKEIYAPVANRSNNLGAIYTGSTYSQSNFVDVSINDYHLNPSAATAIDQGYDLGNESAVTGIGDWEGNPRGIDDPNTADGGSGGDNACWDIGADEFGGRLAAGSPPLATPRWQYPVSGAVTSAHISSAMYNRYSPFTGPPVYICERAADNTVTIRAIRQDTGVELRSVVVTGSVSRIISMNSNWVDLDPGPGYKYRIYCVADTNNDSNGDSIFVFTDNGTDPNGISIAQADTGWATNPRLLDVGSNGINNERARWVLMVTAQNAVFSVCRDDTEATPSRLFKINAADGVLYGGTWPVSGRFDEMAMPVAFPDQYLLLGLTGDTTYEVAKVSRNDGSISNTANAGTSQINKIGAGITGYEPFWTAPLDYYAYRFSTSNLQDINDGGWNYNAAADVGGNSDILVGITDSYLLARRRQYSQYLYAGCGTKLFKLVRDTGALATDSDGVGDEWYDLNLLGRRINTPIVGADDRRVILFGTEGGYLYLVNDRNDAGVGDANSWNNNMGLDGKPVYGYPYRVVGGEVLYMSAQGSGAGTRIMFVVGQAGQVKLYCFQLP